MSGRGSKAAHRYPPIGDYGLIGDCHSAALVSREASIDWCCMPRFDSGSVFGRMLDWDRGGHCHVAPIRKGAAPTREYLDGTLVLVTRFNSRGGDARVIDCMTIRRGGSRNPYNQVLRVIECDRGHVELRARIVPRFDYGDVRPWVRRHSPGIFSAVGGNDGLVVSSDLDFEIRDEHDLEARFTVRASERVRISLTYVSPEEIEYHEPEPIDPDELDRRLDYTIRWWRRWAGQAIDLGGPEMAGALRSAVVLKALSFAATGAISAAPTTSLPEVIGGARNWDYRFSWIRDSTFSVRSLAELGFERESDGFRRFAQRSSAGSVEDLQIVYGVGGERRLTETELELEGWRGSRPVRAGNRAAEQLQLDAYGELLNLAWRWHRRGHSPDDDLWRFLVELVNAAVGRWRERDCGIWEWRGPGQHFVHSKALCWSAVDKGIRLADESMRKAPLRRWRKARDEMRTEIDARGFNKRRGAFVQRFGSPDLDAAVLLLPTFDYVEWADERMVSTVDVVAEELADHGLVRRYSNPDGLEGREGPFLACTFWLVECMARQDRHEEAQKWFDRGVATANDLGLFGEEYDTDAGEITGNYPQGITHLSHIAAAVALSGARTPLG